jgi:rod shape-determining protein MreD
MMNRDIYLALAVTPLLLVIQSAILPRFPVLGSVPNLLLVTAVAWALLRGPEAGLGWAFLAGIALDLFSLSPMGLAAFTLIITVLLVSILDQNIPSNPFLSPLFLGLLATVIFLLLQGLLLQILGYAQLTIVIAGLPAQGVVNAVAILPIYWLLYSGVNLIARRRIRLER